jgi:hypothetical protein
VLEGVLLTPAEKVLGKWSGRIKAIKRSNPLYKQ